MHSSPITDRREESGRRPQPFPVDSTMATSTTAGVSSNDSSPPPPVVYHRLQPSTSTPESLERSLHSICVNASWKDASDIMNSTSHGGISEPRSSPKRNGVGSGESVNLVELQRKQIERLLSENDALRKALAEKDFSHRDDTASMGCLLPSVGPTLSIKSLGNPGAGIICTEGGEESARPDSRQHSA